MGLTVPEFLLALRKSSLKTYLLGLCGLVVPERVEVLAPGFQKREAWSKSLEARPPCLALPAPVLDKEFHDLVVGFQELPSQTSSSLSSSLQGTDPSIESLSLRTLTGLCILSGAGSLLSETQLEES